MNTQEQQSNEQEYKRGYADAMNWKLQNHLEHFPSAQRTAERSSRTLAWVGLTDEEFQTIYDMGRTPAGMMEMVEAKLREKNLL